MNPLPTLSFCLAYNGHLHYLQQTLQQNLDDNRLFSGIIDFVLFDFSVHGELPDWLATNFSKEIDTGYLKYYQTNPIEGWNIAKAKNTAHYWAKGDILVNLDPDGYTGPQGGRYVIDQFMKYRPNIFCHQYDIKYPQFNFGRIAVLKKDFYCIGGYNEKFTTYIHLTDLMDRLGKYGTIRNELTNMTYCEMTDPFIFDPENRTESVLAHSLQSGRDVMDGRLIANNGIFGIRSQVFDIHGSLISNQ